MTTQKKRNKAGARKTVSVAFTDHGWDDYQYWKGQDPKISAALDRLIGECLRTPFSGTGKPEALKGNLTGFWSRRITHEHRLVYLFEDGQLFIVQCRYHYDG
ncbi:toxin YoeB [Pseudomonas delhiensis]|uniref:Putative mRNA interferase YoeB n=1 Tax=Pseudomonas delhiensis TaxID=366289 RepID=A0A239MIT1_9PSED|nr:MULTISPECIES: Txe/YoeB family addiction module toxin [Pseudomonas]SDJ64110.1 toxin YoeB [Pseudomonas delhiensis]SNT42004.1 toxin YoeB [Pseudomonas delhiensis]